MADIFDAAVSQVRSHIPNFEVRYKDESWSSKVIAVLVWLFNRNYMKSYTTTRYPRVYFPSRKYVTDSPKTAVKILAHEFVHLWDRKEKGAWFSFSYALPQLLTLFFLVVPVVLSFFCSWWVSLLGAVPALLCAMPLPAYWRMKWECRGYTMSACMNLWRYDNISKSTIDWIIEQFTGWAYYKMWPFKHGMHTRITQSIIDRAQDTKDLPFAVMRTFVKEHEAEFK